MKTKVKNMTSSNGNKVANQFIIVASDGRYFQSYDAIIAVRRPDGQIELDQNYWDCSKTTGKYRNKFLNETKKETEAKIKSGEYKLTHLN